MSISLPAILLRHAQFLRFLISGTTAFLVNIVTLYCFVDILHIWYLVASAYAFTITFVVSFALQKLWTFRDRDVSRIHAQVALSLIIACMNLAVNTLLMYLFVEFVHLHHLVVFSLQTRDLPCTRRCMNRAGIPSCHPRDLRSEGTLPMMTLDRSGGVSPAPRSTFPRTRRSLVHLLHSTYI
jgi:putative flippase GtrA